MEYVGGTSLGEYVKSKSDGRIKESGIFLP